METDADIPALVYEARSRVTCGLFQLGTLRISSGYHLICLGCSGLATPGGVVTGSLAVVGSCGRHSLAAGMR